MKSHILMKVIIKNNNLEAIKYFNAIKFNKPITLSNIIQNNKNILMEIDYFGQSGYHWAAKRGYNNVLNVLIANGKHINMTDKKKRTPLFLAAKSNYYDTCELLLQNGANPFMINIEDKKPYDVAANAALKKLLFIKMDVI